MIKGNWRLTNKLIVNKEQQIALGATSTFIKNNTSLLITKHIMFTFFLPLKPSNIYSRS